MEGCKKMSDENRYAGWGNMRPIEAGNIRLIEHQFVNGDYKSGYSLERGNYRGLTGEEKRKVTRLASLIDKAFED